MMQRRKKYSSSGASAFSSVPMGSVPLIEITENKRALIENHLGVTSYGLNEIRIKVRRGSIEISGEELEILCMSKERIVICGVIIAVHLWREDN